MRIYPRFLRLICLIGATQSATRTSWTRWASGGSSASSRPRSTTASAAPPDQCAPISWRRQLAVLRQACSWPIVG
eukprot:4728266-Pyramimonas_sp.AAC.2